MHLPPAICPQCLSPPSLAPTPMSPLPSPQHLPPHPLDVRNTHTINCIYHSLQCNLFGDATQLLDPSITAQPVAVPFSQLLFQSISLLLPLFGSYSYMSLIQSTSPPHPHLFSIPSPGKSQISSCCPALVTFPPSHAHFSIQSGYPSFLVQLPLYAAPYLNF
uniref:Uncharacterized protein n=1 Tax=Crocodylus porosus TaxID=8502 RepID=A0A7M4FNL4_CROPO